MQADPANGEPWKRVKFTPVEINYSVGGKKYDKTPDKQDEEILARIPGFLSKHPSPRMPSPLSRCTTAHVFRQRALTMSITYTCRGPLTALARSGHTPNP